MKGTFYLRKKFNIIYPGTFDPFHRGHRSVVESVIDVFWKDINGLTILVQKNRFKDDSMFSPEFKVKLIESMVGDIYANIPVIYTEYDSFYDFLDSHTSYMDRYKLVIGDDTLPVLHKWRNVDKLFENGVELIVVQREMHVMNEIEPYKDEYPIFSIIPHSLESIKKGHISSTIMRERVMDILERS